MITCIKMEDNGPRRDNSPKDVVLTQAENLHHHRDQENIHRAEENNNIMKSPTTEEKAEKYGLRPRTIIKRLQQETRRQEPPQPKPKEKRSKKARPAPLSKYRRKTANARERDRMKAVNIAFESLRRVLPDNLEQQQGNSATTTKITTLRHAVNYIQALTRVLENPQHNDYIRDNVINIRDNVIIKKEQNCDIKSERVFEVERKSLPHLIDTKNPLINTQYQKYNSQQLLKDQHISVPQHQSYITQLSVIDYGVQTHSNVSTKQQQDFCSLLVSSPDHGYLSLSSNSSSSLDSHGSSTSDLDELLSEDSHLLEGNLSVFQDISPFSETDPFDILLSGCGNGLADC